MRAFAITWRPSSVVSSLSSVVCRPSSVVRRPLTFHMLGFSSETPQPNELKLGRNQLWKVIYNDCSFCLDPITHMAATVNSSFWLADFWKSSPLKPLGKMNRNLVGSIYGRSSIKIAHFVPIRSQTWPSQVIIFFWLVDLKKIFFSETPGQMNQNLVGNILGRSSMNISYFVSIR
jgi:hypothetical protein